MKDRVRGVEIEESRPGQDVEHLFLEVPPPAAPLCEIVEDDEPALEQILAEMERFLLGEREKLRLGHVRDRMLADLGIVEAEDVRFLEVRVQVTQLLEYLHEMTFAFLIVVRLRNALRDVRRWRAVA